MNERPARPLLPENIKNLSPYVAGKTIAEVQEEYQPKRISKLASNENRLGCSPKALKAIQNATNQIQDYPDPAARVLRKKIAAANGVSESCVIAAAGSESIIAILCRTFFLNDEHALTADATFVGFYVQIHTRGIQLNTVPLRADYRFNLSAMASAITPQTKMVYIANPNNPTGTYISESEFSDFMEQVPSDVLVIMDEAYYEYAANIDDYPHAVSYDYDNVITLRTFSKAYGLAGCRVGYAIAREDIIGSMQKTKLTFEPTTLGQAAATAAMDDTDFLAKSTQVVEEGRNRLYEFFDTHGLTYVPSVSNSVMMVLDAPKQAARFTQQMLEQGVILRRLQAFGLPNCVRITIGTPQEMAHFEESVSALQG